MSHVFRKEVDEVFIGTFSGRESDPDWTYVDKQGHVCTQDSVEWFVESVEWCNQCEEYHENGHFVCPLCLEQVQPRTRPARQYVPGMVHYFIDDKEVNEDEWNRAIAAVAIAQRRDYTQ